LSFNTSEWADSLMAPTMVPELVMVEPAAAVE